jgi:hypothetical protein
MWLTVHIPLCQIFGRITDIQALSGAGSMASVQAEATTDTTDEEIAARESIRVGHTGIIVTLNKPRDGDQSRVGLFFEALSDDIDIIISAVQYLMPGLLDGSCRSVVLVKRTEDGWHDLLTMHND